MKGINMKEEIKCGLCGKAAVCHGYQRVMVMHQHYKKSHPVEYKKLRQARDKYLKILKLYKW